MKVSELIAKLQDINQPDSEIHLDIDAKLHQLEFAVKGRFLNTVALGARVEFDVLRAEQTIISVLMHQPEILQGFLKDRFVRALGQDRIDFLQSDIASLKAKQEASVAVVPSELKEEIESELNKQVLYDVEPKKVIKKKSKLKIAELPVNIRVDTDNAEELLTKFYKGEIKLNEEVKAARKFLGEIRSKEILDSTRG